MHNPPNIPFLQYYYIIIKVISQSIYEHSVNSVINYNFNQILVIIHKFICDKIKAEHLLRFNFYIDSVNASV